MNKLGKISTGNTPSKKQEEYYKFNDIGFVKPDILNDHSIVNICETKEYISEIARPYARIAKVNSVLVTCIGSIGKIGIVKNKECAFNQQLNAIEPNHNVSPEYLAYCLLFNKQKLINAANAPVVPIINKTQFENFKVYFEENIDTQVKIASTLIKMNKLVSNKKEQIGELDSLVQARFVEMFGDIPNNKYVKMKKVCSIITDGTHQPPKFESRGIPFLFVSNLSNNEMTYTAEKFIGMDTYKELYKRTPVEIGDVLLTIVGSYGHVAVVKSNKKFLFQRHIAYLKPNNCIINSEYLRGALLAPNGQREIKSRVKGVAQQTLNLSEIKEMMIPLPKLELQNKFADFVQQVDKSKLSFHLTRYELRR